MAIKIRLLPASFLLGLVALCDIQAAKATPCATNNPCYHAGPFSAEIVNLITSQRTHAGGETINLRFFVRLTNLSNAPIILAYQSERAILIDDQANRYSSSDKGVSGIGITTKHLDKSDAKLLLQPGEAREITLESQRSFKRDKIYGTIYNYDFTLDQLEVTPSQQITKLRDYNVSYRNVVASKFAAAPKTNYANRASAHTDPTYHPASGQTNHDAYGEYESNNKGQYQTPRQTAADRRAEKEERRAEKEERRAERVEQVNQGLETGKKLLDMLGGQK